MGDDFLGRLGQGLANEAQDAWDNYGAGGLDNNPVRSVTDAVFGLTPAGQVEHGVYGATAAGTVVAEAAAPGSSVASYLRGNLNQQKRLRNALDDNPYAIGEIAVGNTLIVTGVGAVPGIGLASDGWRTILGSLGIDVGLPSVPGGGAGPAPAAATSAGLSLLQWVALLSAAGALGAGLVYVVTR